MVQRPASSFNFQLQFPNDITCYTQVGRYDYIDESTRQVSRNTELNDGDIDIGGNDNVFNSALRQLSAGAAIPVPMRWFNQATLCCLPHQHQARVQTVQHLNPMKLWGLGLVWRTNCGRVRCNNVTNVTCPSLHHCVPSIGLKFELSSWLEL